jgi:hypothetical protein
MTTVRCLYCQTEVSLDLPAIAPGTKALRPVAGLTSDDVRCPACRQLLLGKVALAPLRPLEIVCWLALMALAGFAGYALWLSRGH